MVDKVKSTAAEALAGLLFDGMTIMAGGFGLCGMVWETPFVVHGAAIKNDDELREEAQRYRARVASLITSPADAEQGA